jgi:hypothetical protein
MRTVYKYPLSIVDAQTVLIPSGATFRHVGLDPGGKLCVWAEVDTKNRSVSKTFYLVGTGNPIPDTPVRFLGAVVQGPFVWHVYQGGAR